MRAFDPDPKTRWLFCLTHPDDEVAIGAWIRRLTAAGAEVFLSWTHDTAIRMKEAFSVADLLGVPKSRLFFHHAPDMQVAESIPELRISFEKMVHEVRPDRVACTAFEQGHMDHDATNYLVNKVFKGLVLEFPMYHTYCDRIPVLNRFAQHEGEEILMLHPEEQSFKVMLAKQYPSQTFWRNVFWYEIWQTFRFQPRELKKLERMRIQTHKNFLIPHLPPIRSQKVQHSVLWRRWVNLIQQYESSMSASPSLKK